MKIASKNRFHFQPQSKILFPVGEILKSDVTTQKIGKFCHHENRIIRETSEYI